MDHWKEQRMNWYYRLGLNKNKLKFHEHGKDELAHYAREAYDIMYEFSFGWKELEGVHNRTDFDLKRHEGHSGKKLSYFDDERKERYVPFIIETSAGCDRTILTVLADAYEEEEERTVLRLSPAVAPLKAVVLPLVNKDGMPEMARNIYDDIRKDMNTFFDSGGAIGRRYRRQDEIGTPFGITVDSQSLEDGTVTLRDRDSMEQERYQADNVKEVLIEKLRFKETGVKK